jgi:hypothetical protein
VGIVSAMLFFGHTDPHDNNYTALALAFIPFVALLAIIIVSLVESKLRLMRRGGLDRRVRRPWFRPRYAFAVVKPTSMGRMESPYRRPRR